MNIRNEVYRAETFLRLAKQRVARGASYTSIARKLKPRDWDKAVSNAALVLSKYVQSAMTNRSGDIFDDMVEVRTERETTPVKFEGDSYDIQIEYPSEMVFTKDITISPKEVMKVIRYAFPLEKQDAEELAKNDDFLDYLADSSGMTFLREVRSFTLPVSAHKVEVEPVLEDSVTVELAGDYDFWSPAVEREVEEGILDSLEWDIMMGIPMVNKIRHVRGAIETTVSVNVRVSPRI